MDQPIEMPRASQIRRMSFGIPLMLIVFRDDVVSTQGKSERQFVDSNGRVNPADSFLGERLEKFASNKLLR